MPSVQTPPLYRIGTAMPQTLLALLAMILTSVLAFSQQQNVRNNYTHMVGNEIEMAASGAVMTVLEFIGSRSFDERTTPSAIEAAQTLPLDSTHLSAANRFGSYDRGTGGCDLMEPFRTPDCDDIDDLDGITGQTISVTLSTGLTLDFEVDVEVDYVAVADMDAPITTPTWFKRVIVSAANDLLPFGQIQMERIFAYDPIKAEADHDDDYGPLGS